MVLRGGKRREYGIGARPNRTIEIEYTPLPREVLEDLKTEKELAFQVIDGFKKINWKLADKLGKKNGEAPVLKKRLEEYINELHKACVFISEFHYSERNRAFVVNASKGLDLDDSNKIRNQLYEFIHVVLEKEHHSLIDGFK